MGKIKDGILKFFSKPKRFFQCYTVLQILGIIALIIVMYLIIFRS